ncbi:hypothetical protein SAMN05216338_107514 [Bradyrhizobium sp. Rc2d]|nr:hypothetical protein SAMN05216338_107514 [Bradyrhizobium sp. Rc2d]
MGVLSHLRSLEIGSSAATSYCARLPISAPMFRKSSRQKEIHSAAPAHSRVVARARGSHSLTSTSQA